MPPKCKFTKEQIVQAALEIAKNGGMGSVTARGVGAWLNSSSKVIFGFFQNMDELQNEVVNAAYKLYQSYISEDIEKGEYPPYKASGMAYIRFAREQKELFKILFMCDRTNKAIAADDHWRDIISLVESCTNLNNKEANKLHLEMWVFVHGIATMIATSYLVLDEEHISNMITDIFFGLKSTYGVSDIEGGTSK